MLYILGDKLLDLIIGLLTIAFTGFFSVTSLYEYYIHVYKSEFDKISFTKFVKISIFKRFSKKIENLQFYEDVEKHIDDITDNEQFNSESGKIGTEAYRNLEISAVSMDNLVDKNTEVYTRRSKDYGPSDDFSIQTWYGVNYKKLIDKQYKYICFEVKDVTKIYFKTQDLINLISSIIEPSERNKYIKRNSFDTYLMKGKGEQGMWMITRLGTHLKNPVTVTEKNSIHI